jgi:hypothetical protein
VGGKLHGLWYAAFGTYGGYALWEAPGKRVNGGGRAFAECRRRHQFLGDDSAPYRGSSDRCPTNGGASPLPGPGDLVACPDEIGKSVRTRCAMPAASFPDWLWTPITDVSTVCRGPRVRPFAASDHVGGATSVMLCA